MNKPITFELHTFGVVVSILVVLGVGMYLGYHIHP